MRFWHWFIAMDQTLVHHIAPETKEYIKQWTGMGKKENFVVSLLGTLDGAIYDPTYAYSLQDILSRLNHIRQHGISAMKD